MIFIAMVFRATLFVAVAFGLAALLTGCGSGSPPGNCGVVSDRYIAGTGRKANKAITHPGPLNRIRLTGWTLDDCEFDFDIKVDDSANMTHVSYEIYANLLDMLTVTNVFDDYYGQTLWFEFRNAGVCNTGLRGTITVPAPLESFDLFCTGTVSVDKVGKNRESPRRFHEYQAGRGSLSIGHVDFSTRADHPAADLRVFSGGLLNVSQLTADRVDMVVQPQNSDTATLVVQAGEIIEEAHFIPHPSGDILLNSVTSRWSRVAMAGGSLTGLISVDLVVSGFGSQSPPAGSLSTTVTGQLCADCSWVSPNSTPAFPPEGTEVALSGNFQRTGGCFWISGSCPANSGSGNSIMVSFV